MSRLQVPLKTNLGAWEKIAFRVDSGTEMTTLPAFTARSLDLPLPKKHHPRRVPTHATFDASASPGPCVPRAAEFAGGRVGVGPASRDHAGPDEGARPGRRTDPEAGPRGGQVA